MQFKEHKFSWITALNKKKHSVASSSFHNLIEQWLAVNSFIFQVSGSATYITIQYTSLKTTVIWNIFLYVFLWHSFTTNWKVSLKIQSFFYQVDDFSRIAESFFQLSPHSYAHTFPRKKLNISEALLQYSRTLFRLFCLCIPELSMQHRSSRC